jgi:hypothetical protein
MFLGIGLWTLDRGIGMGNISSYIISSYLIASQIIFG